MAVSNSIPNREVAAGEEGAWYVEKYGRWAVFRAKEANIMETNVIAEVA